MVVKYKTCFVLNNTHTQITSYLPPSLSSGAISLVVVILLRPVGIIASIPVTLLAIPLLRIVLSIVALLAIS
jgi:hypothetical protein